MVKIVYFARLREAFGTAGEQLQLPAGVADIATLTELLRQRGGPYAAELASGRAFRVAVNLDMAGAQTPVRPGDEVAFFPPVTGG